jgi:NADPH2:quinone reductase
MLDLVAKSVIKVQVGQTSPLQEAARAHMDLEARRTIGATVLVP